MKNHIYIIIALIVALLVGCSTPPPSENLTETQRWVVEGMANADIRLMWEVLYAGTDFAEPGEFDFDKWAARADCNGIRWNPHIQNRMTREEVLDAAAHEAAHVLGCNRFWVRSAPWDWDPEEFANCFAEYIRGHEITFYDGCNRDPYEAYTLILWGKPFLETLK